MSKQKPTVEEKPRINIVVIGHVDSGKSTSMGHLVYKCGLVDKETMTKLTKFSIALGKPSFKYAWIFDTLAFERERGISLNMSNRQIETTKYKVTIIDTPGHRDYIKNMIRGTAQADAGILMVSAALDEFEEGISKHGQTREHALMAYTLGIKQLIVCVNKMDLQEWSQARFTTVQKGVLEMLEKLGFQSARVSFVPISGFHGDNMIEKSKNLEWFEGSTLLEALDAVALPKRAIDKPLRVPFHDVYQVRGFGVILVGKVEAGVVKAGTIAKVAPGSQTYEVKSVEMHHKKVDKAIPGDYVGLNLLAISFRDVKKGYVCGDFKNDPPRETVSFVVQMIVVGHPGEIKAGYCPIVYCHTARVACKFEKIIEKMDMKTGKVIEEEPEGLKSGDCAMVKLVPIKPLCVEPFAEYPQLGRVVVRDLKQVVAVGVIKSVEKKLE